MKADLGGSKRSGSFQQFPYDDFLGEVSEILFHLQREAYEDLSKFGRE